MSEFSPHEYVPVEEAKGGSDRSFGLVFAAVFALISLYPLLHGHPFRIWSAGVAVLFAVLALVSPALLAPLNRLWTRLGGLLHKVVSPLILGLVFFGVVTPLGAYMRWRGKDLLSLRLDKAAPSYWRHRAPAGPAPETMKQQF